MPQARKGLTLVLISSIVYGLLPSTVTFCYSQGATAPSMLLVRYSILSLLLLPSVLHRENIKAVYLRHWKRLLLLSAFCTFTAIFLFASYRYISTACASALHFMYPAFVLPVCALLYRDKVSKEKLLCLALCFGGALLMLDTSGGMHPLGVALALGSAVVWGGYIVGVDKFSEPELSGTQMLFFIEAGNILIIALYSLLTDSLFVSVTPVGWLAVILSNTVVAVCGTMFFTIGIRYTDAQVSSIASTLEPITSILVGVTLLGEPFDLRSAFGSVLILAAVVLLSFFTARETSAQ